MVDEIKKDKDSIDDKKWDLKNLNGNLDNLNLDNFSNELNELEQGVRWAMENKAKEQLSEQTTNELDNIKSEVTSDANLDPEWEAFTEKEKKNVSEFFVQWRKEFNKIDNFDEKKVVKKHQDYRANNGNIGGRPLAVQKAIRESVDLIVDDISSRKKEKNPIARSLLKIVDLIMSTEK